MRSGQLTTSAALFYRCEQHEAIPLSWFERALEVFREHGLSPTLFTAAGGEFELDDCCLLADGGGKLFKWGDPEPIIPRRGELVNALRNGVIYCLRLDIPRADSKNRSDWHAAVSASSIGGKCYVGVDEELISDPAVLLHRACEMAKGLFDVRYGIAYKMPLAEEPDCYASGSRRFSFADFQEWMRQKREGTRRQPTRDDLWSDELMGKRRHLTGHFRGAFPASVLSASHVRAADLKESPVGRLTELDNSLWLWELSEREMPQAETMLEAKHLLVNQAAQP